MKIVAFLGFLGLALTAQAQTPQLTVGSAVGKAGETVVLPLTFTSASRPIAGLEWKIAHEFGVEITAGPATSAANKNLVCSTTKPSLFVTKCLAVGTNSNTVSDGTVASIRFTLPADFSGSTRIGISGLLGSSPEGKAVFVNGASGLVSTDPRRVSPPPPRGGVVLDGFRRASIQCPETLRLPGEEVFCVCRLDEGDRNGGWFSPFTTNENVVEAFPKQVWVNPGQKTFEFRVRLIVDPGVLARSLLIVGAGRENGVSLFGHVWIVPSEGGVR